MKMKLMTMISLTALLMACGGNKTTPDTAQTEQTMEESSGENATDTAPAESAESQGMGEHHGMMTRCPMHVDGTALTVTEAADGVALKFTNAASVEEVQSRTQMLLEHHPTAMEHHGSSLPAYTLSAENADDGAMLVLKADDAAQAEKLATDVQAALDAQGDAKCPMMIMYDHEPKHGPESAPAEDA